MKENTEMAVEKLEISLSTLKEIINNLPPLEEEVNRPLPDKELLSKEYYDQLFEGYISYMSNLNT
jgi:hypothetical protein